MPEPRARIILEAIRSGDAAFKSFQAELDGIATKAKLVAAAAGAALALVTKNAFENVDALTEQADALGIATDKLAGLQLAAKLGGVEAEQFNKALARQTKAVFDAVNGSETARRAFSQLGLQYQELARLSPDEQFMRISDAMASLENTTQRIGLASELFGTRNLKLINTLAQGSDALRDITAQAERFGLAIDRVDAAKIELANDKFDLLKAKIQGFGNLVAVEISPALTAIVDGMLGVGGGAEEMSRRIRAALDMVGTGVGMVLDAFHGWRILLNSLKFVILEFASLHVGVFEGIVKGVDAVRNAFADALLLILEAQEAIDPLGIGKLFGRDFVRGAIEGMKGESAASEFLGDLRVKLEASASEAGRMAGELARADRPSQTLAETVGRLRGEAEQAAQAIAAAVRPPDQQPAMVDTKQDAAQQKAREKLADELEQLRQSWLSKEQVEAEALSRRQTMLRAALDQGLIDDQRYSELATELQHRHWSRMKAIQTESLRAQRTARLQEFQVQVSAVQGVFSALASLTAVNAERSKASFELNKKIGIANAIVSTAVGVTKALELGPWGLVQAAAIAAAGAAQIAAIRSTTWQGEGGAGAIGFAGGATSASPVSTPDAQNRASGQAQAGVVVNVTVQGSVIGRGGSRQLAEDLTALLRQHVQLSEDVLVTSSSRNGRMLG